MYFRTGGSNETVGSTKMVILSGGNVGINDTTPDFGLDVQATAAFPNISAGAAGDTDACLNATTNELTDAGAASCIVSSIRYKENIKNLPNSESLSKVLQLNPISFNYKPEKDSRLLKRLPHIGLIAEDMALVEPRLVFYEIVHATTTVNGAITTSTSTMPRGIDYESYTALLTGAIKEIWQKITNHENRIEKLERENIEQNVKIEILEMRLKQLETK